MREYDFKDFSVIAQKPLAETTGLPFTEAKAERALRFHRSLPDYKETRLVSLQGAAERYRVKSILVKDESSRFGLKAFKGLGGSYCVFRALCEKFGMDADKAVYSDFLRPDICNACGKIEFATATDGNHGKGVAWAAKLFGCGAHVYMPCGSVEARRRAIEEAGAADAEITELNYDETVRYAAAQASKNGWILIQDTSWDGYEKYPGWIIEGYLTMAAEAEEQMDGAVPTHIFLQAGVGAMAGGIEAFFADRFREKTPSVAIAEPREAACVYRSVLAGDGEPHSIAGNPSTIMAGLNCGTPCGLTWEILRDRSSFFVSCDDSVTEKGMRAYARPAAPDDPVISGESGALTYGLLISILESEPLRDLFGIGRDSVILLFNTEGDTDPEGYRKVVEAKL